ncbi:MAG: AAA family ATPase [Verrucomicrobia bacterium]|nr:AAA family ATPase [Verrucomicrobiota bacterium]
MSRWETYNFTDDFQDTILACLIKHPAEFYTFGHIVKPAFFNGAAAVDLMFSIQKYVREYGKYPSFGVLANYAFDDKSYTNVDAAKELLDYVIKLSKLDTSDWKAVLDLSIKFCKERSIYDAIRCIHAAQSENLMHKIDPRKVIDEALSVGVKLEPESDTALLDAEIEDAEPVVKGMLDRGEVAIFGAASKSHKTWLNLHLVNAIAYLGKWLGFTCRKGKVLYVNFELTRRSMQKRLLKVQQKLGIKDSGQIDFFNMKGVAFDPVTFLGQLKNRVDQNKYIMVVIDPFYALEASTSKKDSDNAENSNFAMGQVMLQFIGLAVKADCAVWVCHHFGKGNQASKEALDRLVGGGVIGRALDTAVIMTKHKEHDPKNKKRVYALEFETRNHYEIDPFVVRWVPPLLVEDAKLNPAHLAQPKKAGRPSDHSEQDLLKVLRKTGMTSKEWLEMAEEVGIRRSTYFNLKKELIAQGLVVQNEARKWLPESDH